MQGTWGHTERGFGRGRSRSVLRAASLHQHLAEPFWRYGIAPTKESSLAQLTGKLDSPGPDEIHARMRAIAVRSYSSPSQAELVFPGRTQRLTLYSWNVTSLRSGIGRRTSRKVARISGWLDVGPVVLLETHWDDADLARFETITGLAIHPVKTVIIQPVGMSARTPFRSSPSTAWF